MFLSQQTQSPLFFLSIGLMRFNFRRFCLIFFGVLNFFPLKFNLSWHGISSSSISPFRASDSSFKFAQVNSLDCSFVEIGPYSNTCPDLCHNLGENISFQGFSKQCLKINYTYGNSFLLFNHYDFLPVLSYLLTFNSYISSIIKGKYLVQRPENFFLPFRLVIFK